jgi:diaminopimelate decarboxylase
MVGFARSDGALACEGLALAECADRFGTPLYVYSGGAIREGLRSYQEAFASVPHRVCYALKANSTGGLLRILAGLGAGADVVSGAELEAAMRAGFPADRIVFSGVGKTEAEMALAVSRGIAGINAESEGEVQRLDAVARSQGRRARVALRVNPDIDSGSHPYVSTGSRHDKFGVDIARAPEILERARRLEGVQLVGVQCHIGSQIQDLGPLEEAARELAALSRMLIERGFRLETIDVGGGLAVDYEGEAAPAPRDLAARILPVLEGLPLTLLVEPGRSVMARAGVLLCRVVTVKENRDKRFVVLDAGMNDLLRPALYGAFHRVEPVVIRGRAAVRVDVVGPVCESGDFLARDREIETVEPGDLVALRDAGAYGMTMASNYNMRPRAAEVLVEEGRARLVRRRETFEDLVGTEVDA